MPDVKVLVAGSNDLNLAEKGDVVDVVPFVSDWGTGTVTPNWVRLTITGVPGATQELAENNVRKYLDAWEKEFIYSDVTGADTGLQRYRVEASPEIANDFTLTSKLVIRDRILTRFNGSLANQSSTHFEFDTYPGLPLDEIAFEINQISYRRFKFDEATIDAALATVNPGEPVEFTRTMLWVSNNITDKLRS